MMEVIDAGPDAVFTTDDRLEGGAITLGSAPGLGITFDDERLAKHAVERLSRDSLGMRYRRASDSGTSEPGIPVLKR